MRNYGKSLKAASDRRGEAMIVVVCVMFVFVTISLILLLAVSVLTVSCGRERLREQCRISAMTFSELIKDELTSDKDTELKTYLLRELKDGRSGSWYYYDPEGSIFHGLDSTGVVRTFDFGEIEAGGGKKAKVTLELYWETVGETDVDDPEKLGITLIAVVNCKIDGETYIRRRYYDREVISQGVWKWNSVWRD